MVFFDLRLHLDPRQISGWNEFRLLFSLSSVGWKRSSRKKVKHLAAAFSLDFYMRFVGRDMPNFRVPKPRDSFVRLSGHPHLATRCSSVALRQLGFPLQLRKFRTFENS